MPFDENGFLGKDAKTFAERIEKSHIDFFQLCYDINRFAQKIKFRFEIHNKDGQEVITACLFIRILEGYQASILLVKGGFSSEARALIRIILESLILLKICCEDANIIPKYILTDEKKRLKLMQIAHKYNDELFALLRGYATKEIMVELAEKVKTEDIKELIIEQLAIKVGMKHYYDSIYRLACDDIHTSPRVLERYVIANEEGDIVELNNAPKDEDARSNLLTLADFMLIAMVSMLKLHKIDEEVALKDFYKRLLSLEKEHL
jgi:phosphotransferase system HPr-like phosphotransfer protein